MELVKFIFADGLHFIGFIIILGAICTALLKVYQVYERHKTLRRNGWPPSHCDADGFPVEMEIEEEEVG